MAGYNFIAPGDTIPIVHGGTVAKKVGLLVGSIFGITVNGGSSGTKDELYVKGGVFELPKTAGQSFSQGAVVYWDNSAKSVTGVATSNYRIGVAYAAAAGGDATAQVRTDGVSVKQEPGA